MTFSFARGNRWSRPGLAAALARGGGDGPVRFRCATSRPSVGARVAT